MKTLLAILLFASAAHADNLFRAAQIVYPVATGFDLYETHRTCAMPLFREPGQIRCESNPLYPTRLRPQIAFSATEVGLVELLTWKMHQSKRPFLKGSAGGILLGMTAGHLIGGFGQRGWRLKYQFSRGTH